MLRPPSGQTETTNRPIYGRFSFAATAIYPLTGPSGDKGSGDKPLSEAIFFIESTLIDDFDA